MSDPYAGVTHGATNRSSQLDQVLATLLRQAPDLEAAAVVSFDGLPMASALPAGMDEDRVAAMSAALLSLGERAAQGLGRGDLSQVYVEGDNGTVFLVSADDEAVLVAVGRHGAKVGLMLFEVKQAAEAVANCLRAEPEPLTPSLVAVNTAPVAHVAPVEPVVEQAAPEVPVSPVAPVQPVPIIAPVSVMPVVPTSSYDEDEQDMPQYESTSVMPAESNDSRQNGDSANWTNHRSNEPVPTVAPEPGAWS